MHQDTERISVARDFFTGLVGLGRALSIIAFAALLSFLARNIFVGIALAAVALYAWMLRGEIDALEKRMIRLEHP